MCRTLTTIVKHVRLVSTWTKPTTVSLNVKPCTLMLKRLQIVVNVSLLLLVPLVLVLTTLVPLPPPQRQLILSQLPPPSKLAPLVWPTVLNVLMESRLAQSVLINFSMMPLINSAHNVIIPMPRLFLLMVSQIPLVSLLLAVIITKPLTPIPGLPRSLPELIQLVCQLTALLSS